MANTATLPIVPQITATPTSFDNSAPIMASVVQQQTDSIVPDVTNSIQADTSDALIVQQTEFVANTDESTQLTDTQVSPLDNDVLIANNQETDIAELQDTQVQPTQLQVQPTQVTTTQPQVQPTQTQVTTAQPQVQPTQTQVTTAQSQVQPTQPQVQPAQTQVTTAQSQVQPTQPQVQPAQTQVTTAQSQVQPAQTQVTTAQSQVQPAQTQVTTAQTQVTTAQSQQSTQPEQSAPTPGELDLQHWQWLVVRLGTCVNGQIQWNPNNVVLYGIRAVNKSTKETTVMMCEQKGGQLTPKEGAGVYMGHTVHPVYGAIYIEKRESLHSSSYCMQLLGKAQ